MQQKGPGPSGRLLIVEDEDNIARSLRRVLRRLGCHVETARDAEEALQLVPQFRPEVVLSDYRMPGMNGVDFLERVKALLPHTQRIMLTGQADHQAVEDAINRSQVFRFLSKPWDDAQLVLVVKDAFDQHRIALENEELTLQAKDQNGELRRLNADLENRVQLRTHMLSRAKREWELTFDTIDYPLSLVQTNDYTMRRANRAAARAAGRPIEDLNGRPRCFEFLFGRQAPCAGCPMGPTLDPAALKPIEISWRDRTYVLSIYPMEDEAVAVCSYRDVSEERAMTRRLVESEKMIAIGQLAGGVAHEINNPLGGILAFAQLMKREPDRSSADLESLALIEESALRCKRIVESLLKFSRRSRVEDRRNFDISRCVEDAALLFRAQIKKYPRCKLVMELGKDLPEIYGDPAQMGQVMLNLLQNALQALPGGEGRLTVKTGQRDAHVFATVEDTGCGIPEEHRTRIFEPHFTTKPPGEGTGLGLSIAYRIVEDHGGHFVVESEVGRGTAFSVMVPVTPGGVSP